MRAGLAVLILSAATAVALESARAQDVVVTESYTVDSVTSPLDPGDLGTYFDRPWSWMGTAWFDVMLLQRSNADPVPVVMTTGATPTSVFDATDFAFPTNAGFRFNWILPHPSGTDVVVGYMGTRLDQERTYSSGSALGRYFNFRVGPLDGMGGIAVQQVSTLYETALDSAELNWRARRWERFAPLTGVRFTKLKDEIGNWDSSSTFLNRTVADNEMWGFQIGADAVLYATDVARLETTTKTGVYYNDLDIEGTSGPVTIGTTTVDPDFKRNFQHVSTMVEVTIQLVYQPRPNMALRVGYNAIWLDGVALAPDQYDNFNAATGQGFLDLTTVLFHGSHIGFEMTW